MKSSLLRVSALALLLSAASLPALAQDAEPVEDGETVEVPEGLEGIDPVIYQSGAPEVQRDVVSAPRLPELAASRTEDLAFEKKKLRKLKPLFGPNSVFGDGSK